VTNDKREEQRLRVLAVAAELFSEHGFDDVTMADIARASGVARATVFNYFGSKYALVEEITKSVVDVYSGMLDDALADEHAPTAQLVRGLFADMGKGIEGDRRFFRGVFREIARIQLGLDEGSVAQLARDAATDRMRQLFERGQQRGDVRLEHEPQRLAEAMSSLANGTITSWLFSDGDESLVTRMSIAADVFLSPVEQEGARP
jgi:AcrR family transcriptional regulator